jgi:hypothetical protein
MANLIEFYSTLDGYDQVQVSRNRSVFMQLREIIEVFAKAGYEILGNIEYQDRQFKGEYRMISSKEEVVVQVH